MPDPLKRNVFVLTNAKSAINHLKNTSNPKLKYSWVYLGKSVTESKKIQQQIGNNFQRLFTGDLLQEAAQSARQDYIDYTGLLLSSVKSPIWFLSSLSERNPFVSRFLVHYSYIEAVRTLIVRNPGDDLVIICESEAVFQSLIKALSESKAAGLVEVISIDAGTISRRCSRLLWRIVRKCWFLLRFTLRIICARFFRVIKGPLTSPALQSERIIALHCWTDSRSFPATGKYVNNYFGTIGETLEQKWPAFLYVSDVLPSYWYPRAVFRLLKTKQNVCLVEEFISIRDLFNALFISSHQYPVLSNIPPFLGVDVSALVNDEIEQDRSDTRVEQTYLYSCTGRGLCRVFDVGLFLYAFEHHTWEKMFCEGIKKSSSTTTLAGYAIVFVNPMYTCYSLSEYERSEPLPDIIFVSGEQGRSMLIESGFDKNLIRIGGAIRYPDFLLQAKKQDHALGKRIVLALSGELNSSLELVYKALDAYSSSPGVDVIIKCHPTVPYSALSRHLPRLPAHFSVADTPISQLLPESCLVLYTESTVCVEAVALGVPVIHVRSDHSIDINIFEHDPAVPSCADPQEIREQSEIFLNGRHILPSQDTVKGLFMPVDRDAIIQALIDLVDKKKKEIPADS